MRNEGHGLLYMLLPTNRNARELDTFTIRSTFCGAAAMAFRNWNQIDPLSCVCVCVLLAAMHNMYAFSIHYPC